MADRSLYNSLLWRTVARRAKQRDGDRCGVARLLGGDCRGPLHAHHVVPVSEGGAPFDLSNVLTVCAACHPRLEALRRALVHRRVPHAPRCPHDHRSPEARRICERRLARQRGLEPVA